MPTSSMTLTVLKAILITVLLSPSLALSSVATGAAPSWPVPEPPGYDPAQCPSLPRTANDWQELRFSPGPLPDPRSEEDESNLAASYDSTGVIDDSPCRQLRHFEFSSQSGIVRTKPYNIYALHNIHYFVWSGDGKAIITAWYKPAGSPPTRNWSKKQISPMSGATRGTCKFSGYTKVMFDVSLQPMEEGVSGEIALFWTTIFADAPGITSNGTQSTGNSSPAVLDSVPISTQKRKRKTQTDFGKRSLFRERPR